MKFSRITAAATLSSALLLAACSADDTTGGATTDAAEGAGATTSDDAATTTDDAAVTAADATGETVEMTTDAQSAALSLEEAEEAATEVLTQRVRADQGDGDDVEKAQEASLAGTALRAHRAADRLEPVTGEPAQVDLEENPVEPIVLAISREDDQDPDYLLVQTVPEDGVPYLHLLESKSGDTEDFRITWEARMLPDTEVPTFAARSEGSPVLRSGQGDLTMEPRELLKSVGAYTAWPQPDEVPDYRTHGYAPSVRQAAEEQAAAISGQASLREKNWLVSDDVVTLLFEDGSGFVMGSLLRDTQFVVNEGSELTTPDEFRVFQDSEVLTEQATLRTSVFVGMRAPSEGLDFKPEMLAATEQLVDASGE
ncbi:hypothetical protein [Serinicoccus sediminis]|uniref:hypothetical protein n=1 Tax=Serinicoccus sediminis TaxID=2306021 RepID=UPI001022957E|nr:hypothetical protein [Serinicoccus sediminis]